MFTQKLVYAALALVCFAGSTYAARFAVIGDFGTASAGEAAVANMVHSWYPFDSLLTVGDNNYPSGRLADMDPFVGAFYHRYMYPFVGSCSTPPCGSQDGVNRFWPSTGNHDWGNACPGSLSGYLTYMPVNRKAFYDIVKGDTHIFFVDSDCNQNYAGYNGTSSTSSQAMWLQSGLAASTSKFKLVIFHHPPYSSGDHGSSTYMRWPFEAWGAHAVLTGHDHDYERVIMSSGFPYFVNGIGGADLRPFVTIVAGSTVRSTGSYGAQLVETSGNTITFKAFLANTGYPLVDCYQMTLNADGSKSYASCMANQPPASPVMSLLTGTAVTTPTASNNLVWKYFTLSGSTAEPTNWRASSFDASAWPSGQSPLGYGPDHPYKTTLVDTGATGGGSYLFRRTFCLTSNDLSWLSSLSLSLFVMSDNRASVWINGVQVLAEGSTVDHEPVYWNTNGNSVSASSVLVAGLNVIAAQVTNTASSSDAAFDIDLRYPGSTAASYTCAS
eukprot:CAMPEP_0202892454 /NCGR_PEP_ID=MMETSP1392-20130828/2182_1 /ASSEMBLY_ACC=CAM_ASM_000868 /TAXON_ID=225041 /ORGANISM="Chlamydomonas chlamydogama, Strain SAG 11-48b" /LENGTH=498 /DNA_ID=CAMNT_0049576411 /DNA_START=145 /DNA_END=1637 /DNA_ORIENTATION=-